MKAKVLKFYGQGQKAKSKQIAATAKFLGMTPQRIYGWHDELTKLEVDGILAALVRKGISVPLWLLK